MRLALSPLSPPHPEPSHFMLSDDEFPPRLQDQGYITDCMESFTAGLEAGPFTQLNIPLTHF